MTQVKWKSCATFCYMSEAKVELGLIRYLVKEVKAVGLQNATNIRGLHSRKTWWSSKPEQMILLLIWKWCFGHTLQLCHIKWVKPSKFNKNYMEKPGIVFFFQNVGDLKWTEKASKLNSAMKKGIYKLLWEHFQLRKNLKTYTEK